MKCSNPNCNRGIGLVCYRRGWFRQAALLFKELLRCFRGRCTEAATNAQCDLLLRVAFFTTDWEFAAEIDPRSHPHKGALNIQQENGEIKNEVRVTKT